jgi:hypothetical protein
MHYAFPQSVESRGIQSNLLSHFYYFWNRPKSVFHEKFRISEMHSPNINIRNMQLLKN